MHTLSDMFVLTLPWIEKLARPVIVYFGLVLLVRLFGKREFAQLNPFDLIVVLCLSNTLQNAIIGDDNSVTGGFIGALGLLGANYFTVRFLFRHPRLQEVVEGRPTVLIDKGEIVQEARKREVLTVAELRAVAHRQGIAGLDDVERMVLEPAGTFGVIPKEKEADHSAEILARLRAIEARLAHLR